VAGRQAGCNRKRGRLTQQAADHEAEDQATRETIRTSLEGTLFVEAGAGTGKTTALVDRVVALVIGGKAIERIVAITFTERAAAELRDRVRAGLGVGREQRPECATAIDQALASLDRAQICTIHAFCQALLYSFAAEAGIDPSFRVQDEVMAERRFHERWRLYLESLGDDAEAGRVIDRALGLGLSTWHMETLAKELAARPDLPALLEANPPVAGAFDWPSIEKMHAALAGLPLTVAPKDDKLRERVERLVSLVDELRRRDADREAALAAGGEILKTSWNVSRQDVWGRDGIARVREVACEAAEALNATLRACRSEALSSLLPLIVRFVIEDAHQRGRDGTLTFDDLILLVRDLLRSNREAVRTLRGRYDVLLIDEFQDTDPLQVEIAMVFATDPETGALAPGRLFLVGDPKQSIYRFRRADMAIYAQARDRVEESGGSFPVLAMNRRSRGAVLDWVNKVFEPLIGPGWEREIQPEYRPIYVGRAAMELSGPGVAWIGGETGDVNARQVREMEAGAVVANCLAVLEEGWEVGEQDGTRRPASLSDIAVLIPTRAVLPALERAFGEAELPYRVESGSLIYRTQEVRDLLNCLTAIDDPADEVAIVAALRSTAFACSDLELAEHKALGGGWNYLSASLAQREGRVADALRLLAEWHAERHESSLAALVERFVADQGQVEIGILDAGNRNSFRRARFVVEQARAFEAREPASLRAFVNWMESRAGQAILDNEGAGLDDDEEAVRVLTIHGAKGLEFPIVFVAGLGSAPMNRPGAYMADRSTGEIAVCIGSKNLNRSFEVGPTARLEDLEKRHTEAEYARLLYVATTRARDHLIVSLYSSKRASSACGARVLAGYGAADHVPQRSQLPRESKSARRAFEDLEPETAEELTKAEFEAQRKRLLSGAMQQRYTSATAIGQQKKEEKEDESEPWSRGRGGTRLGRAVHAAIQSLPLDADGAMIAAFSRSQAVAEAIPHRDREVERLVDWVLRSSQAAARARSARRSLREVPFAVAIDGTVLEGFIDLVIETDDGIEIVDWKTDDIEPDEIDTRLVQYKAQAGLYVYGLEAALGRLVTDVTYVFAKPRLERSLGDRQELRELGEAELLRQREEAGSVTSAPPTE
jgi:ATP-dependent helicase/nuclease subunit A